MLENASYIPAAARTNVCSQCDCITAFFFYHSFQRHFCDLLPHTAMVV